MRLLHASILHIKTEKQPFPFTFVCVRAGMGKGCCFRQYEDQAAQKNIEKARQNSGSESMDTSCLVPGEILKVLFGCHSTGITDERQKNKALLIQNSYASGTLESRLWACWAPGVRCLTQRYSYTGLPPTPLSPGLNRESPMRCHCKPAAWWKPNSQDGAGAWLKKPSKEETTPRWAAVSQPAGIRPSAWGLPPGSFRQQEECYLVHERQSGIDWVERGWDWCPPLAGRASPPEGPRTP